MSRAWPPLLGREREQLQLVSLIETLVDASLDLSSAGRPAASERPRLLEISGPPGIGKSRLTQAVVSDLVSAGRYPVPDYATGGWSVGAVALVAGWAARTYPAATTIAAIFPDGPQRYFDTVFNDDYCHLHGLLDGEHPAEPRTIGDPSQTVVQSWTRCARVANPTEVQC